jgi:hypothetical protein
MAKETKPLKVSVTLGDTRTKREYTADYAFVGLMNEDGVGCRWEQEPIGWKGGLGLFHTGMEAFKVLAEQEGEEGFKTLSRAVMDLLRAFEPGLDIKERVKSRKKVVKLLEKVKEPKKGKSTKAAVAGEGDDEASE